VDLGFTLFFSTEIGLKLFGFGAKLYFSDPWNVYDFIIVFMAIAEKLVQSFDLDATAARLVRVLRVFRFFRLVSAFASLNKLVVALYESVLEVAWVGVLAVLLLYMVGCLFTTAIGHDAHLAEVMPAEQFAYFGSVQRSMLSLLQIMTTDGWCSEIARTFVDKSPATAVLIVIFMIFSALILMNLLAAIYVDKLMQLTDEENKQVQLAQATKKAELQEKLKEVFLNFDDDGNGVLTQDEIVKVLKMFQLSGELAL
jgi:voltage-gated sodium channel